MWIYGALLAQSLLFMYSSVVLWSGVRRNNLNDVVYGTTVCGFLVITMMLYAAKLWENGDAFFD